jgi:hypothetical protein
VLADDKGVPREEESEGSLKQSSGLTNRNRIRQVWKDEFA